jgi:hypothetical protein
LVADDSGRWKGAATGIGRHLLNVSIRVEFWTGAGRDEQTQFGTVFKYRREFTLTAPFDVVPDVAEQRLVHVTDEALLGQLRAAVRPTRFYTWQSATARTLNGVFDVENVPVDLSFAVTAIAAGKEYSLGSIIRGMGEGAGSAGLIVGGSYDGPLDVSTVDLILRPDDIAARRTVWLHRIWDGTLEFKDVPVKQEGHK